MHSGDTPSMRLAIYCDATVLGGAEVNLSRVLGALPATIHVTLVGVDDEVVRWLGDQRPGTDTMVLPTIVDRRDVRGMLRHRAMFTRLDADVLQFNLSSGSSCQWAILAASTLAGQKLVVIENSPMAVWSSSSARLKQLTSKRLAAHVAVGERAARLIETSSGLPTGSISTLYHGVPPLGREPVERPDAPTLLAVARHDPVKGVDVLLEAFALVPEPTRLVLIGDGPERAALGALCTRLGLDERVEFRESSWGSVRASDLMWAFDGLVLPSRLEGFPVTIVEAMLSGLPVIATDVGSVREAVVPGETGWVVPPEDPTAMAAAIGELVADLPAARRMGEQAQKLALQRFTIDATVESYLELYRELLAH